MIIIINTTNNDSYPIPKFQFKPNTEKLHGQEHFPKKYTLAKGFFYFCINVKFIFIITPEFITYSEIQTFLVVRIYLLYFFNYFFSLLSLFFDCRKKHVSSHFAGSSIPENFLQPRHVMGYPPA